jgi:TP901 family phage tail tape measure protein
LLQRQLAEFNASITKSNAAAAAAQKSLQRNLIGSINSIGSFSAELRTVRTTAESFTNSLENNKFSMREYFRYAGAATKTFGNTFKAEFDTIGKVAEERVKTLQTQYIKMGRDASGAMKAIAVKPTTLDMTNLGTQTAIAAQKQAIFNQLLKQGSTNLLNFGKNTQWAGRQLMVGFTLPLVAFGAAAAKSFQQLETEVIKFRKVYGDLGTNAIETEAALKNIQDLADGYTKYGVAVAKTVGVASAAAAAGFQGADLLAQTEAATKLAILGQIDQQQALETTISLQNAFKISSTELASTIDFLNAVENQTVTSLDDITTAIPKVAPVIQQLGGDVKDLAFFLTAMKEGGVNASEGANALKSGLASLINPSKKANDMLASMGININNIVTKNKGNLKATVVEFAKELDKLDPLSRARAIETMFGKFQFARISTLLSNVIDTGNQASRVLDLAGQSAANLAGLTEKELGITAESALIRFQGAVAKLQASLAPVGEVFMNALVPVLDFISGILDKFNNLGDGTKKFIAITVGVIGGLGPVLLMTFGLLANGIANILKLFATLRSGYQRLTGQSQSLGAQTQYLTTEQMEATAAAHSLQQSHARLTQQFTVEATAVNSLRAAYQQALAAGASFASLNPGMMRAPRKLAIGGIVRGPGTGTSDSIPAMISNGEAIIPAKTVRQYPGMVAGLVAGNIPGFAKGRVGKTIAERTSNVPIYGDLSIFIQNRSENLAQGASTPALANVLAPLVARIGEARGLGFGQTAQQQYPSIIEQYRPLVTRFLGTVDSEMQRTAKTVTSANERIARAWQVAGRGVDSELSSIGNSVERGVLRQALGVMPDSYGSIATDFRANRGFGGRAARYQEGTNPASYMNPKYRSGTSSAFKMLTGREVNTSNQDYGHVFDLKTRQTLGLPTTVPLASLRSGLAPISPSALASINNSIRKASTSIQTTLRAAIAPIHAAGVAVGQASTSGIASGAMTASPSKATTQTAQDIIAGLRNELARQEAAVRQSGLKIGTIAVQSIDSGAAAASKKKSGLIGPNMPAGATMLPIVSSKTKGKVGKVGKGLKGKIGKISGPGGGLGIFGATMVLDLVVNAAPDFKGKDTASSLITGVGTGASLGMMAGPKGAAIGAIAGGVLGLTNKLMNDWEAESARLLAFLDSLKKPSTSLAEYFGNTVVETDRKLGSFNVVVTDSEGKIKSLSKATNTSTQNLKSFKELLESLPEGDPLKAFIEELKNIPDSESVRNWAEDFVLLQVAANTIDASQAQKTLDLILAASDHLDLVGTTSIKIKDQGEAITKTLEKAALLLPNLDEMRMISKPISAVTKDVYNLADGLLVAIDAARNATSMEQFEEILKGIDNAAIDAAVALNALKLSFIEAKKPADAKLAALLENVEGADATTFARAQLALEKGFDVTINKGTTAKDINEEIAAQFEKAGNAAFQAEKKIGAAEKAQIKINEGYLKTLEARKKIIDDTLKKEQKISDEFRRQNQLRQTQQSIDQKIIQAKLRGNFVEAQILQNEKQGNAVTFANETMVKGLQDQSEQIADQISKIESNTQALEETITALKNNTKEIKGWKPGRLLADAQSLAAAYIPPGKDDINQSGFLGKNKTTYQVFRNPYTLDEFQFKTNEKDAKTDFLAATALGYEFVKYSPKGETRFKPEGEKKYRERFTTDGPDSLPQILIVNPDYVPKTKSAMGGHITGPGSGTSDSIPALLSNGEYVVKASSVAKYGTGFMDTVNAGKFAEGGMVNIPRFGKGTPGGVNTQAEKTKALADLDAWFKKYGQLSSPPSGDKFPNIFKFLTPSTVNENKQSSWSKNVHKITNFDDEYLGKFKYAPPIAISNPFRTAIGNIFGGDAKWNDYTSAASAFIGGAGKAAAGIGKIGVGVVKAGFGAAKTGIGSLKGGVKSIPKVKNYTEFMEETMGMVTRANWPYPNKLLPKNNYGAFGPGKYFAPKEAPGGYPGYGNYGYVPEITGIEKIRAFLKNYRYLDASEMQAKLKAAGFDPELMHLTRDNPLIDEMIKTGVVGLKGIKSGYSALQEGPKYVGEYTNWMIAYKKGWGLKNIFNAIDEGKLAKDRIFYDMAKRLKANNPTKKKRMPLAEGGMVSDQNYAMGGMVPKFHNWNGVVPGQYGQELNAVLKSGTEGVYQNEYIAGLKNAASGNSSTSNANTVYNIDMTVNGGSANANDIANQVMKKLQVVASQNNKSNKVVV